MAQTDMYLWAGLPSLVQPNIIWHDRHVWRPGLIVQSVISAPELTWLGAGYSAYGDLLISILQI